ncbi:MAG: aldose 1-epimerase family protein [Clostridia bacterium]|nr:aldose 1-epimerase family protein [Clostridia bacterium]
MGTLYTIEDDRLRVAVSDEGAELQSVVLKNSGEPLLWNGDPAVWRGRAPWLFPIVGRLKDDCYLHDGRKYFMGMHGFARKSTFAAESHTERAVRFVLSDTPETRSVFPWRFELRVACELTGGQLQITCAVRNTDKTAIYFSLGAHPGLLCEAGDELRFEGMDALTFRRLTADSHLLQRESEVMPLENHALTLRASLFERGAMILEKPACAAITLKRAHGPSVRLRYDPVPWLGIWTKPVDGGIRYVCLEPWLGVDDPVDATGAIERKEAVQSLEPGGELLFHLAIEPV